MNISGKYIAIVNHKGNLLISKLANGTMAKFSDTKTIYLRSKYANQGKKNPNKPPANENAIVNGTKGRTSKLEGSATIENEPIVYKIHGLTAI